MRTDTKKRYGSISRYFHWGMAVGYLFMFGTAVAWNIDGQLRSSLMGAHKAVGFALAGLAVLRLLWAVTQMSYRPENGWAARAGHLAMYGFMFVVPALGIARQIGRDHGYKSLVNLGNQWHGELGWALLVLIIGHIVMTIIHQCRGDSVLARMRG